jgi:hypothetical protein
MENYRGPFDPHFRLGLLSRRALAVLGREYQLAAHLQDRAGIPQVLLRSDARTMRQVAIEEWMGASPIYTRRMQQALRFEGSDVATIFKGMQLDVGAPHGFLDFNFRVDGADAGEFWLPYCGALMDAEPMGESFVVGMCHEIEDPTFDATAAATNARAQIRPIHRPPRVPPDRVPHCRWRVRIEPDAAPVSEHPLTNKVRQSRLAQLRLPVPAATESGGWPDYSGPFDANFELESLAHPALVVVAQEFCVQGHLLVRAFMMTLAERWGDEVACEIATKQWTGIAGVAAERVVTTMGVTGGDLDALAKLFQLHPAFHPRAYVDLHVERHDAEVVCWIGSCPALAEGDRYSWFALSGEQRQRALDAMARVVNPHARCRPREVPGAAIAWAVRIDPSADPAAEPPEVTLTKLSKGATFQYAPRRASGGASPP